MIIYNKNRKAFLLCGKNYSYAMYVNGLGFLQSLHYGAAIDESDLDCLTAHVGNKYAPDPRDNNCDIMLDGMPNEYSFCGRGDFHEPAAVIQRRDGAVMSRFLYSGHKITDGAPEVRGLPHARRGGKTLAVTLTDEFSSAQIVLYYIVSDDSDVLVRYAEIKNTGDEPFVLKKVFSFCTELPEGGYSMLRLHGNWLKERTPEISEIAHGVTKLQSLRGASSHQMNPFAAVMRGHCSETHGECYGIMLLYSGSWTITAEKSCVGSVRIQGGINDFAFSWQLGGGETFTSPQTALCYSGEGLGHMSREYADFIQSSIVRPDRAYAPRPIVVNNWEGTYFNFDNKKLFDMIDASADLGADTFVLDDGWFGIRNDDRTSLGDWVVNTDKLEGGLKPVIDRCKKRGLGFGLWFEPEMVSEDSDLYRAHPDWAVKKDGVNPVRGRNQLVLDLTRGEVVDHVYNAVADVLRKNEISYVKWDFNREITELYSAKLPPDRQGEFMHRYVLGMYDLAGRLTGEFKNVFFEGCAGGGRRFDAGMLYYFPQIWTSDNTDGLERAKIQWGTSVCYPLGSMSCHVSVCPNHQTGRIVPMKTRGAIASLGAFGYELDVTKLSDDERSEIRGQIAGYKKIAPLVLGGDLYRLISPFDGEWFCVMVVSKDKTSAYVVGERIHGDPFDYNRVLRLCGLDGGKVYRIVEEGITASGKALTGSGVILPKLKDYESFVWHIEEVVK